MISSQELRSLSCSHDSAATCAVLQASRSCVEPATCEVPYYDYGSLLASRDEWVNPRHGRSMALTLQVRCKWRSSAVFKSRVCRCGPTACLGLQPDADLAKSWGIPKSSWVSILSHGVPSFKETSICPDPDLCSM